jgi:hypothetical protein
MAAPWWSVVAPSRHDLAATSRHGEHRLGVTIASTTRQWHHAMANVASVMPWPTLTQQHHRHHDSAMSSSDQATPSHLGQDEDLIIALCVQIREESIYYFCTLLFSFYPILICRSDQTSRYHGHRQHHREHDSAMTLHHGQHRLCNTIASKTRQHHR